MSWFRGAEHTPPIELPDDPGEDRFRPASRREYEEELSEDSDPDEFQTIKMDGPPVLRASQEGGRPRKLRQHVLSAAHQPGRLMGAVWPRDQIALPGTASIAGLLGGLGCGFVVGFGAGVLALGAACLLSVQ